MVAYDLIRNNNTLGCCWGTIKNTVNKFHGFYEQLEKNPLIGATPEVIVSFFLFVLFSFYLQVK